MFVEGPGLATLATGDAPDELTDAGRLICGICGGADEFGDDTVDGAGDPEIALPSAPAVVPAVALVPPPEPPFPDSGFAFCWA